MIDENIRWQRVKDVVADALERAPARRDAFVRDACAGDESLRAEVDAYLGFDDSGDFLVGSVIAGEPEHDAGTLAIGERVGQYEITDSLGEGGFSLVYGALQHEPIRRRVALKVIKPGMDSRQVVQRFAAEREALARMEHPHIARVLDAGTTAVGRPYFVMERVDGLPFTEYCDANKLNNSQRIRLFLQVCDAVQHAHHKGVIHRDLKPSNVLVEEIDGAPSVKVIDFGIAKALVSGADATIELMTQTGMLLGTPEYMSPEQAGSLGDDVDTRADVYSLGVLLYETLTGVRPFAADKLRRVALDEVFRIIREEDPPRPSTRIEPATAVAAQLRQVPTRELRRSLQGDLDWICMKSLEKERERRYSSVSGLADDLARHLADQPVEAGPPGLGYRFGKLARRNRALLAATAVALVALLVGAAAAAVGFYRASHQRDLAMEAQAAERDARAAAEQSLGEAVTAQAAEREARAEAETALLEAESVGATLEHMIRSVRATERGKDVLVRELLAEADFSAVADQPLVEARLRSLIGFSYRNLGYLELAEEHLRRVLEIAKKELDTGDSRRMEAELDLLLVRSDRTDNSPETLAAARDLLERSCRVLGEENDLTIDCKQMVAIQLFELRHLKQAVQMKRELLDQYARSRAPDSAKAISNRGNLAVALSMLGELDEAEKIAEELAEFLRGRGRSEHVEFHRSQEILGTIHMLRRDWIAATEKFVAVVKAWSKIYGETHVKTLGALNYMALTLHRQGNHNAAETEYQRLVDALEETLGPGHRQTMMAVHNYAMLLDAKNERARATEMLGDVLKRYERYRGEHHFETSACRFHLGQMLPPEQLSNALLHLEPAVRDLAEAAGWKHPVTVEAAMATLKRLHRAARAAGHRGQRESAIAVGQRAWRLAESIDSDQHRQQAASALAGFYGAGGDEVQARDWRRRAGK